MADGCQCATCKALRDLNAQLVSAHIRIGELSTALARAAILDANVQRTRAAALAEAAAHLRKQALDYPPGASGTGTIILLSAVDKMLADLQGPSHV